MKTKMDWKKKLWWFVRSFPAISYGIIFALLCVLIELLSDFNVEPDAIMSLVLAPFIPIFLIYGGLGKITNEIICIFVIFGSLLALDLITFLLKKLFTKIFGFNLFTRSSVFVLTFIIWLWVFLYSVGMLPIDT